MPRIKVKELEDGQIKRRRPARNHITHEQWIRKLIERWGANDPAGCIEALNKLVDADNEEIARRVTLVQQHADEVIGSWEQSVQQIWDENRALTEENKRLRAEGAAAEQRIAELEQEVNQLTYTKAQRKQGGKKQKKQKRGGRRNYEG